MESDVVYWDPGSPANVWHAYPDCKGLQNAERIRYGTKKEAELAGKKCICSFCQQRKEGNIPASGVLSIKKTIVAQRQLDYVKIGLAVTLAIMFVLCIALGVSTQSSADSNYNIGYTEGYNQAEKDLAGADDSYDQGYSDGYADAEKKFASSGTSYSQGYSDGRKAGYDAGYETGYDEGYYYCKKIYDTIRNDSRVSTPVSTLRPTPRPVPTSATFRVTASVDCIYNNSVGNEWSYYFEAGSEILPATITARAGDDIMLFAKITEDDSIPDVGTWQGTTTVKEEYLENGFHTTVEVYVTEGSGRYSGNEAKFEVTFNFEPQ